MKPTLLQVEGLWASIVTLTSCFEEMAKQTLLSGRVRLLKKAPAFAEAPALRKASGGGASRRQADAS